MITKDHINYLKNTLEPDGDAYPWHELYEWDDMYLKTKLHQEDVQESLKWKSRYSSLKQSGLFFNNICAIDDLVWFSKSLEEFKLKLAITEDDCHSGLASRPSIPALSKLFD